MKNTEENNMKNKIATYLDSKYTESDIEEQIDSSINSGNWTQDNWEDEYDSLYECYIETGRGAAETEIRNKLVNEICNNFKITCEDYEILTGQYLWDYINSVFPILIDF